MKKVADLLCILITFSIRAAFYEKALRYAKTGYLLFPEDRRFTELYAYALTLSELFDEAETVLSATDDISSNLAFLRARVSIMNDMPKAEQKARINQYLTLN